MMMSRQLRVSALLTESGKAWLRPAVFFAVAALSAAWLVPSAGAAQSRSEQQLLEILRSPASLQEKDAACAELKRSALRPRWLPWPDS